MNNTARQQRWLKWKNYDVTETPTCPRFGCIELFGFETIGAEIIMKGRSPSCFDRFPEVETFEIPEAPGVPFLRPVNDEQGAQWYHCFNSEMSVATGQIGRCTFDLPTWAAIDDSVYPFGIPSGVMLSMGNYLGYVDGAPVYPIRLGKPWHLGTPYWQQSIQPYLPDENGWNNYFLNGVTQPDGSRIAFIGGMKTFLRASNSVTL
jgi:hypothetical protein